MSTGREARIKVLTHNFEFNGHGDLIHTVRRLAHANVAALFDIHTEDSVLFAASEWVDGETLRQKLDKGRLPAQKAAHYAAQIALGLAAAHSSGLVHSDLKPENIRIGKDGKLKIIDFGLANLSDSPDETANFADYASPEQVRGEPETHASDIFSLGVILYEMLSGIRPFLRPTLIATANAILTADPPHELPPGVTPALGRIAHHCLAKYPADRFASASDLAFALDSFWNLTLQHDRVRRVYNKSLTGVFLGCALGLFLGLGMGALIARRYLRPVAAASLSFRNLTASGHDSAPSASADGETLVYSSDRDGAPRIWTMRLDTGQETPLTAGPDRFPRLSPDGKNVLFIRQEAARDTLFSMPAAGGTEHQLMSDIQSADWLPSGGIVWLKLAQGIVHGSTLGTASSSGQDAREIAHLDNLILTLPRCSPDGTLIAAVAGPSPDIQSSIFVTPTDGEGQQYSLAPPSKTGNLSGLAWTSDNRDVVYFQSENRATADAWAGGGAHVIRQNAKTGGAAYVGFSQQNARVVDRLGPARLLADSGSRFQNLEEIALGRDPHDPRPLTSGDVTDQAPVYSHSGESIFFSAFRGSRTGVWEVARKTGATRRVVAGDSNDLEPYPFSDGKRILWSSDREGHFEIYWASLANPQPRAITHDGVGAEHPSITADDEWVVYNSKNPERLGIWKVRQNGIDDIRLVTGETRWPVVSPDGKYVLYTLQQGPSKRAVQIVSLENGKRIGSEIALEIRPGSIGSAVGRARWMPGARSIAYIALDDRGRSGVYAQDFAPATGPTGNRRMLGGFGLRATQSFAISADGQNLTIAALDQSTGIVEIGNVPGLSPGGR